MIAEVAAASPKAPAGDLLTSPDDAARYQIEALVYQALLAVCLGAVAWGAVPAAVLAVIPLVYMRYALCVHELMHYRRARVHPLLRLMPLAQSIVTLGYDQHRDIHLRHHAHLGTPDDPEGYLIDASHARASLHALFATEIVFVKWVRRSGVSAELARDLAIRAALFLALLAAVPGAFLAYLAGMRAGMALTELAFHHVLHCREMTGENSLSRLPRWVLAGAEALFGADKVRIVTFHDTHHARPAVAAKNLAYVASLEAPGEASGPRRLPVR